MIQLQLIGATEDRLFNTGSELRAANLPERSEFMLITADEECYLDVKRRIDAEILIAQNFAANNPLCFVLQSVNAAITLLDTIQLLQAYPYQETVKCLLLFALIKMPLKQAMLERWRIERLMAVGHAKDIETAPAKWAQMTFERLVETHALDHKYDEFVDAHAVFTNETFVRYAAEVRGTKYNIARVRDCLYSVEPALQTIITQVKP